MKTIAKNRFSISFEYLKILFLQSLLLVVINIFSTFRLISQNWMEPVNVSNMAGLDGFNQMPDFCFDQNGVIHCVWVHVYEVNFSKVFYSKSFDEGMTWTTAEDVSLNTAKRISEPHIVCDTNNHLHLCYDFDMNNYYETLIYYKTFTEAGWSTPDTVSVNMPGSYHNRIVMDQNNRLYCFWFLGLIYYRYLENDIWSDINIPFPGSNELFYLQRCVADSFENLHCIGQHIDFEISDETRIIYFKNEAGTWSDFTQLSNDISGDSDISLDTTNLPHTVWKQNTSNTSPPNDGTMYSFYNGISWYSPELIVEDPKGQQIIMDIENKPNIIDIEKTANGQQLVYYYKFNNSWQGHIIDETTNAFFNPKTMKKLNKILLCYTKSIMMNEGNVYFTKMDMIADINEIKVAFYDLDVYPNPFKEFLRVDFFVTKLEKIQIMVYSLEGKLIALLSDKTKPPGAYNTIWNGKDQNGKEVKPGIYLVRLQAGRKVMTRSVELIK